MVIKKMRKLVVTRFLENLDKIFRSWKKKKSNKVKYSGKT